VLSGARAAEVALGELGMAPQAPAGPARASAAADGTRSGEVAVGG